MYTAVVLAVALPLACLSGLAICFNHLVSRRNRTLAAWHGLEAELQRRYSLIPRLAETAKGYAAHEAEILERAALLRSRLAGGMGPDAGAELFQLAELGISSVMSRAEAYPALTADRQFEELAEELSHTESVVANARKYYNACVMHYDNSRQRFPGVLVARLFRGSFPTLPYLQPLGERGGQPTPAS
jgi:LemA protein